MNALGKLDLPICRTDLVKKAAESAFRPDFDWLDDKVANRVAGDSNNRGLTALEIREYARDWIRNGGEIKCVEEKREPYKEKRYFHYDIVVKNLDGLELQRGLYVEMQLTDPDEDSPVVSLLNAHPPSF